jgi:hypothetical protein
MLEELRFFLVILEEGLSFQRRATRSVSCRSTQRPAKRPFLQFFGEELP